ncbi:GapA-binding peptide SR1P [Cohnella sp. GbtcB17]|uniref:GapA-binding peptide SR1P n=1 Tax=Cohnella sp. GbtcB17 TaxID=2824762 RepID=UPI001C2FEB4A|nr:GapA-binding peptide SR1P [Cohnella sp. GbtcB17]
MSNATNALQGTAPSLELGMVICKHCQQLMYTIPTNGVKKIYGVCGQEGCLETVEASEGED